MLHRLHNLLLPEAIPITAPGALLSCILLLLLPASELRAGPMEYGVEYDLMAPRIGKWSSVNVSAWVSQGNMKYSLVFADIDINNNHLTDESFERDDLSACGVRGEYYFGEGLRKWNTGLMLLYSTHDVMTAENHQEGTFGTLFVGVPIGYSWRLWDHFTIQPSISILYPLTNRTVRIGIDEVDQAPWGLEPGIRIGWRF